MRKSNHLTQAEIDRLKIETQISVASLRASLSRGSRTRPVSIQRLIKVSVNILSLIDMVEKKNGKDSVA